MPGRRARRAGHVDDGSGGFIDRYHEALDAFVKGDPEPVMALFSRREEATLANPLGPPARGWPRIEETTRRAASAVRDGEGLRFERLSEAESADLAYIFEIERLRMRIAGSDELAPVALRTTTVFRREPEGWRIDHRHADPIMSPRPPESIIER